MNRTGAAAVLLMLTGCATQTIAPVARLGLKLPPATLGEAISIEQHLTVERGGRIDELDAAIEVDDTRVKLVGLAFGQRLKTGVEVRALPQGWRIEEAGLQRRLYLDQELVTTIDYSATPRWTGTIRMNNHRYKYRLTIQAAQ